LLTLEREFIAMSAKPHKKESEARRDRSLAEQYNQIGIKAVAAAVKAKSGPQRQDEPDRSKLAKHRHKVKE
jgi:hypothetical protein